MAETPTFEAGLEELEKIVRELESGDLPLERSLALFEKGVGLSESCRHQLQDAETKVEVLLKKGRKLEAQPFALDDHDDEREVGA
ncbi:MAG: exodeoxyribonuclease VII small subunit [Acidobacteria bacterium]|nr:exodeoxyribonuclease VII small subunit [Acidobacteriota bacterium]